MWQHDFIYLTNLTRSVKSSYVATRSIMAGGRSQKGLNFTTSSVGGSSMAFSGLTDDPFWFGVDVRRQKSLQMQKATMHKLSPRNMPQVWRKLCRNNTSFPSSPIAVIVLAHLAARVLMDPVMRKRAMIPHLRHVFGLIVILIKFLTKRFDFKFDVSISFVLFKLRPAKNKSKQQCQS